MNANVLFLFLANMASQPAATTPDARTKLQPFQSLVGEWRVTGIPDGSREARERGFWAERHAWEWQFKGTEAWLSLAIRDGKHYTAARLLPLTTENRYRLQVTSTSKQTLEFDGELKDRRLLLERVDGESNETQRLVVRLLHSNRVVWHLETKAVAATSFRRQWQLGATKEGEPFAAGSTGPECIVSGGVGTIPVTHNGQTYYVCCSGCRDEFNANPPKYIAEYEATRKRAKEK